MNTTELAAQIRKKQSYLCVGLDPDLTKIPSHFPNSAEGFVRFCEEIIAATDEFAVSYKVNSAFFERLGSEGWRAMERVFKTLKARNVFAIADAKRADIGNTSSQYAHVFFDNMGADAVTIAPYMGSDSIAPFLQFENKTAILLALTSNPGHADFEMQELKNGKRLFEQVIETALKWPKKGDLMFVVGATRSSEIAAIRKICPDSFLLVPGIGAQGGSLAEISKLGMNKVVGLLVNASRSIIYASSGTDFASKAAEEARSIQQEMAGFLKTLEANQ